MKQNLLVKRLRKLQLVPLDRKAKCDLQQEADDIDVKRLVEWIQNGASPQAVETALGVEYMSYADAKKVYRKLLLRFHADKGGDHNTTIMLNQAWGVYSTKLSGENIDLLSEEEILQDSKQQERESEAFFSSPWAGETIDSSSEDTCSIND